MKTFARKTGYGNGHKWEIGIGNAQFFMTRGIRLSRGLFRPTPRIIRYPHVAHFQAFGFTLSILWGK